MPSDARSGGIACAAIASWRQNVVGGRLRARHHRPARPQADLLRGEGEARSTGFGDPIEMVDDEKQRRIRWAAEAWLVRHPETAGLEVSFDVIAVRSGRLERLAEAF